MPAAAATIDENGQARGEAVEHPLARGDGLLLGRVAMETERDRGRPAGGRGHLLKTYVAWVETGGTGGAAGAAVISRRLAGIERLAHRLPAAPDAGDGGIMARANAYPGLVLGRAVDVVGADPANAAAACRGGAPSCDTAESRPRPLPRQST